MICDLASGTSVPLHEVLDELDRVRTPRTAREQRKHPRWCYRGALRVLVPRFGLERVQVTTRNISESGVAFLSLCRFCPGETLIVPLQPPGGPSLLVLARVHSCRQLRSGFFAMGARFVAVRHCTPGEESIPLAWLGLDLRKDGFVAAGLTPLPGGSRAS